MSEDPDFWNGTEEAIKRLRRIQEDALKRRAVEALERIAERLIPSSKERGT